MKNSATALWHGKGVDGHGTLKTNSKVLDNVQYSYKTRFENGTTGTTPEELIAAAHAGCFAMKLAYMFDVAGFTPDTLDVKCDVDFEAGIIKGSHLVLKAKVKGISKEEFNELVADSGKNCPVSLLLKTTVTVDAVLM